MLFLDETVSFNANTVLIVALIVLVVILIIYFLRRA